MGSFSIGPADVGSNLVAAAITSNGSTVAAVAGVTGTIIRVYKIFFTVAGATTLTFEDGSTALSGAVNFAAAAGPVILPMDGQPWFTCGRGNTFNIANSGSVQISGTIYYTQTAF